MSYLSWRLMMKKELSIWKFETLPSSHDYKMAATASRITSSHNFHSRSGGLPLQEFPLIRMKNQPQHPSLHVLLARTRSYNYSLASHWQKTQGLPWLVGSSKARAREGNPSPSTCCPQPEPDQPTVLKEQEWGTTTRTKLEIFRLCRMSWPIEHVWVLH